MPQDGNMTLNPKTWTIVSDPDSDPEQEILVRTEQHQRDDTSQITPHKSTQWTRKCHKNPPTYSSKQ